MSGVYRAALAPLITLIPAVLSFLLAGRLVGAAAKAGLSMPSVSQQLLIVLLLGAGTDYGLFLSSRVGEELARGTEPREAGVAVLLAATLTLTTVTSAGIILAGTFAVLGIAGGSSEAQQLGFSIAFGVLLDTFFVRTLLIPSIASLLGRWNWWPSHLFYQPTPPAATAPHAAAEPISGELPGPADA